MPESLGGRLRAQRERQHIALSTIAAQTKIQLALLEGLERDDVSHWPTGIFRRAFLRAYALGIGLEPDVVVQEFLERHPDPLDVTVMGPPNESGVVGGSGGLAPPTRVRYFIDRARSIPSSARAWILRRPGLGRQDLPVDTGTPVRPLVSPPAPDLLAAARLCTQLSRVDQASEMALQLREAARILDAIGLVVWVWDSPAAGLIPVLAHGYSTQVLAQLPNVKRESNNATAAAFRSGETCVVNGKDFASGALAVPLMTPQVCVGVLAVELRRGLEQDGSARALATIFAAQLAGVVARLANSGDWRTDAMRGTELAAR
jgi:hypothetical protein